MNWFYYSLIGAILYGIAYLSAYYAVSEKSINSFSYNLVAKLIAIPILIIVILINITINSESKALLKRNIEDIYKSNNDILIILLVGILSFIGTASQFEGQSQAPNPSYSIAITEMYPLIILGLVYIFYKKKITLSQLLGIVIIFFAIDLINS